jgi:hypothetical protein
MELSNIALRLIHMESTRAEQLTELIGVASGVANELRDLKAELISLCDTLIGLSSLGSKK